MIVIPEPVDAIVLRVSGEAPRALVHQVFPAAQMVDLTRLAPHEDDVFPLSSQIRKIAEQAGKINIVVVTNEEGDILQSYQALAGVIFIGETITGSHLPDVWINQLEEIKQWRDCGLIAEGTVGGFVHDRLSEGTDL